MTNQETTMQTATETAHRILRAHPLYVLVRDGKGAVSKMSWDAIRRSGMHAEAVEDMNRRSDAAKQRAAAK